jgi:hypothetical protein
MFVLKLSYIVPIASLQSELKDFENEKLKLADKVSHRAHYFLFYRFHTLAGPGNPTKFGRGRALIGV